jgi:hypothetical protein
VPSKAQLSELLMEDSKVAAVVADKIVAVVDLADFS